jgi:hypothetical protein
MSEEDRSRPIRKIDDATYGVPPRSATRRRLLAAKRWFLLDANRNLVAGLMLGGTFVTIVLVGSFGPVSVQSFLTEGVSPGGVLVELLKSIVSVVVIVLSINQLVLSPGLGPVGEQRQRYEQSRELRQQVEARTGVRVSPASPSAFLGVLLDAIADEAERLAAVTSRVDRGDLGDETSELADDIAAEARTVGTLVSERRFGEFEVISAALRFAITEKVRSLRAVRNSYDESIAGPIAEAFDEVDELLELFTVAREYLKTVYLREEYIRLSEGLLYTGLPAIVLTYCAAQIWAPGVFLGRFLGVERRLLFVSAAVTIGLGPFVLLISYVFRLTSLSRSTLFVGPFDARETGEDRSETRSHGR